MSLYSPAFIGFEKPERLIPQLAALGIPLTRSNFGFTTTTGSAMYELVREGAGIALLPTIVAGGRLGLKRVLPDIPTFSVPVWLVTHREIQTSRCDFSKGRICGRVPLGKRFLLVICSLAVSGHLFGLFGRRFRCRWPSCVPQDEVPNKSPHSVVLAPNWVVLTC